ncbi:ECF-type sigma factor [Dokdonella sp.]|uniref:ECF-type sigma factor n=1 Tax=Dokdonella sp. TaxID=2291710 RepID=UPI003783392F
MDESIDALLASANDRDTQALKALFARVYAELKLLARKQLAIAPGATLNTTGLVHEVYLKLAQPERLSLLQGRRHFFALAARAMRQIVIDRARARIADKRGGGQVQFVVLEEAGDVVGGSELAPDQLLRLDHALTELAADEPRLAELVELRFFAGMDVAEIAVLQGVSERTLNRDWRRARAQLHTSLFPDT